MLPDFDGLKRAFIQKINADMQKHVRNEPILSQIKHYRHYEGNQMNSRSMDGNVHDSNYRELSSKFEIRNDEVISGGYLTYIEKVMNTATDIQGQEVGVVFKTIGDVTEKTGNVVDGRNEPFGPEMILAAIDKVLIDFDENGNPKMPSFVFHPSMRERVMASKAKLESDPEFIRRHAEIIEKKRKEWHDRESNRKLVD